MAEKTGSPLSDLGPRSLRRNYPHQVQGVRPGRLSRVGSPAVLLITSLMTRGGKSMSAAVIADGRWQIEDRRSEIGEGRRSRASGTIAFPSWSPPRRAGFGNEDQELRRRYPLFSILYPRWRDLRFALGLLLRGGFLFCVGVKDGHPHVLLLFPDGAAVERAGMVLAIIGAFNLDDASSHDHVRFI